MATTEEKQEIVDHLSGPRFYRINITGYGGEGAYMGINKKAYDFWNTVCEEDGDSNLVDYMLNAEDDELDDLEVVVPPEAQFLRDADGGDSYVWFESPTEYEHQYGVELGSAYMDIDETDSADYNAKIIAEVISRESVSDLYEQIGEDTDWEVELYESSECYAPEDVKYIAQMYSIEKGVFFDGIIETVGDFDPKKLKIYLSEYDNGEDTITLIEYDGVEVDNCGGDTNGKGYAAAVWKNGE
jgi:hypothetical protein